MQCAHLEKWWSSSTGRIIPCIMENNINVWNHQAEWDHPRNFPWGGLHWIQIIQCSGKYQRWMSQLTHWMSRMWDDHQRNSLNIFTWGKLGKWRGKSNNSPPLWLSTIGWSNQHCMEFRWITTNQLLLNLEFFAFGCVWKRGITLHNPETAVGEHHDKPWKSGRIRRLSKWWVAGDSWGISDSPT